ncbi:MAG: LEA type 2 family protein [Bacteroidetes bacterium]|nr:LEA type 2 family protein [Bacteroidota bacterium]HET6243180.1 LEA type 2 family protein [Bacteroidia bacterium]
MKKPVLYLFILLAVVSFSACSSIEPLSVSKVENIKLQNFSKNSLALEVTFIIKNPNRYKFKITDNNFNVFLNNAELGTAKIKKKLIIPKKSEDSYTFIIETQFSKLAMGSIPSLLNMFRTKQVEFKLIGEVKVKTLGVGKRFPVEIVEKVAIGK